jgi:mono/diheme cytochrome c family protein
MDEQEKRDYLDQYAGEKKNGVPFFPDIIFKDAVIALIVFIVLICLAYFIGAALEPGANPADTTYTPRPEWYFLFLFQLLKYFPGKLEVVGVVLIPSLVFILLFLLPLLDRNTRRHFLDRPIITGVTLFVVVGIIVLTILAVRESPPPVQASQGDPVALLYTQNCAPCHKSSISVPPGTNLHNLIAQGSHAGMPAWSGDLSSDQIDELAGFILSPGGSTLFNTNCSSCHKVDDLVGGNPVNIKNAIEAGNQFAFHTGLQDTSWSTNLTQEEKTTLFNFLIAPDGQRLFTIYCSPCHGSSVSYSGKEGQLRDTIVKGGLHTTMPAWQNTLTADQINLLANYVVNPSSNPDGQALFTQYCSTCHGDIVPSSPSLDQAKQTISNGGAHKTMPVWGDVLTKAQIDALVNYIITSSQGSSVQRGQALYTQNCASCHGDNGQGGPNPASPNEIIPPIGTANFLNTRDDMTLFQIISQGQSDQGMPPFGTANGGGLEDDQINSIVAYIRSWQMNPPITTAPQFTLPTLTMSTQDIYSTICAQCHGQNGQGTVTGPTLNDLSDDTDEEIASVISQGITNTNMLAFGSILTQNQITDLVAIIRQFPPPQSSSSPTPTSQPAISSPTFDANIQPIFQQDCQMCHGTSGGWDSSTYKKAMTTGDHSPVIIPGDVNNSILAQKLLGKSTFGGIMPPGGKLPDSTLETILEWI